jgi:hypothetical protein
MTKNVSQRDSTFKGGIQKGTTAFDVASKKLDKQLKESFDVLSKSYSQYEVCKQFTKEMKIKYIGDDCFGFAPDGGAWFKNGKLVAVFEAKKQGKLGNANERWYDNADTAKYINKDVVYVTFCSGAGAAPGECLDKMRRKATITKGKNFKFFMNPVGFTDNEVLSVMENVLKEIV